MHLTCDRDIRAAFGLSDASIARAIGKTRQAVNAGLDKTDHYLRPQEWLLIILALRSSEHPNLDLLYCYLRGKYSDDPATYSNIVSAFGNFSKAPGPISASVIVSVLADYRYFRAQNPRAVESIISCAINSGATCRFLASDPMDRQALGEDIYSALKERLQSEILEVESRVKIAWIPEANQYPYLLCCDPDTIEEQYLVCVDGEFRPLDKVRGKTMYMYIKRDLETANKSKTGYKHELLPLSKVG